jgi:hypothetical protein
MSKDKFLWCAMIGVHKLIMVAGIIFFLSACEDRYRYACQNPSNFELKECQKPQCQFTQTCPEYLVAPVLEKKVEPDVVKSK